MIAKLQMAVTLIGVLFELAKNVSELVKKVEQDDPEDGNKNGEEKKKLVLKIIGSIYDGAEDVFKDLPIDKEKVLDISEKLIEAFVAFYNAIGFFRK